MAGVTHKIIMAAASGLLAVAALAGPAQAGCGGSYAGHHTTTSTLPPLSSYFEHEAKLKSGSVHCHQSAPVVTTKAPVISHRTPSLPPLSSTFQSSHAPLSPSVISGLGQNEGLRPTTCPVTVDTSGGGRVLGCYNVVRRVAQPVTKTTYYRVVRPIVYVRYPVPVPVCRLSTCGGHHHHHYHHGGSRYGYGW